MAEPEVQERWFIVATNAATNERKILMQGSPISGKPYWESPKADSLLAMLFTSAELADFYISMIMSQWPEPGWVYSRGFASLNLEDQRVDTGHAALLLIQKMLAERYDYHLMLRDVQRILQLLPVAKKEG